MRKMYSMQLELTVLRTLTLQPDSRAAQDMLSKIDVAHFATSVGRESFKRCLAGLRTNSQLPFWEDLISDPKLDETIRDTLEGCELPPLVKKDRTRKVIERLNDYRKLRLLTKLGRQLESVVNGTDAVNVDEEITNAQNMLSGARSSKNFRVLRIGKNSNAKKQIKKILKGSAVEYIPTGFDGFDSINRGISRGSYFLIAAPTGAGKSALINQLGENMANSGAKIGIAPLEMENIEMLQRNLARVSKTDMHKLLDPENKLNNKERKGIYKDFMEYDEKLAKKGGSIEFYEFDEDITIENLTSTVLPFDLDVLAIDYLGLLSGTQNEDQWRALGNVARFLHIWGKANGVTTVAAAQLSEDGLLRYSKQMAEHAKYFWYWRQQEINKSTGIYDIIQGKARQASDHTFPLKFTPAQMHWGDPSKSEIETLNISKKEAEAGRDKSSGTKTKWKKDTSVGWEDDDEVDDIKPKAGPNAQKHIKDKFKKRGKPSKKEVEL